MSLDPNYGLLRRTRVNGILSQEVPSLDKTTGKFEYRLNTTHGLGNFPSDFSLTNNTSQISTPYESIINEEIYSKDPETPIPGYLTPVPHTAPKSTASNSNTLTRTPVPAVRTHVEHGRRGTSAGSKRGRETTGKSGSQQGHAHKRNRRNRAASTVRSSNGRDAGGGGEEDEDEDDEDDEDEEDEESDEDDGLLMSSGPKEPHTFLCPMPSCGGKDKLWDNWNNLIQHLQNTHIKGFSVCERGCGRRFGLSSQYTRHVFKRKKDCKPLQLSGPPRRIPSLALDFNHAVGKVKGQNYTKLKQVIADHKHYDLEDPNHVEPPSHGASGQNLHQPSPQGQPAADGIEEIIRQLREHQRVCRMQPQVDPPSSGSVQVGSRFNSSSRFTESQRTPQNPIDPAIQPQLNQSAIPRPDVYNTQPSVTTAAYIPGFQNGSSSSPSGSYTDYYDPYLAMRSDYANQYLTHPGSYIDNNTRANRGASLSELGHGPLAPTPGYSFNPGATYGNGTSGATRFNSGS